MDADCTHGDRRFRTLVGGSQSRPAAVTTVAAFMDAYRRGMTFRLLERAFTSPKRTRLSVRRPCGRLASNATSGRTHSRITGGIRLGLPGCYLRPMVHAYCGMRARPGISRGVWDPRPWKPDGSAGCIPRCASDADITGAGSSLIPAYPSLPRPRPAESISNMGACTCTHWLRSRA